MNGAFDDCEVEGVAGEMCTSAERLLFDTTSPECTDCEHDEEDVEEEDL